MLLPAGTYYPVPKREIWGPPAGRMEDSDSCPESGATPKGFYRRHGPQDGAGRNPAPWRWSPGKSRSTSWTGGSAAVSESATAFPKPSTCPVSTTTRPVSSCWVGRKGPAIPSPRARTSALVFRYIGNESKKSLKSEFRLLLKRGDESREKLFTIPILYNYVSRGSKALLGLTGKKLQQLKRGDTVKPVLPQSRVTASPPRPPLRRRAEIPAERRVTTGSDFPCSRHFSERTFFRRPEIRFRSVIESPAGDRRPGKTLAWSGPSS